jgi:hypothetical protein
VYQEEIEARTFLHDRAELSGAAAERIPGEVEEAEALGLMPGGEESFFFAWGRSALKLAWREMALILSLLLNAGLIFALIFTVRSLSNKDPLVFVRDAMGTVVQADASGFLHAGRDRTEAEVKAFVKDWVVSAYTWTPLDVKERQEAALSRVDGKAKGKAKAGMRLAERREQVEQGISGGIYRDSGREPQAVMMSNRPFTIRVSFQRYVVDRAGVITDAGPLFVFAVLSEVPRSSENGYGLIITDLDVSREL